MKIPALLAAATVLLLTPGCGKSNRITIQNKGSDTMLDVAQSWAEQYRKVKPDVMVSVGGGGSGGGIKGIIDGTVDIANASRRFHDDELAAAKAKHHDPVEHHVGFDGIAIFVHKDNPLPAISIEQLKQIYADKGTITKWSQLGVTLPAGGDDIVLVSRQNNSGTYDYFLEAVLGGKGANFRMGTLDMNGSKDVVDQVSKTRTAIGYSGLAYGKGAEVRMLPVIAKDGAAPVAPSIATVLDKTYPISRPLFMYTIGQPQGAAKDYLDWILSDAGQRVLLDLGYPPVRHL